MQKKVNGGTVVGWFDEKPVAEEPKTEDPKKPAKKTAKKPAKKAED